MRTSSFSFARYLAVPALALLPACGGEVPASEPAALDPESAASVTEGAVHLMPMQPAGEAPIVDAGAHLTYFGGPVLKKVNVIPVYWNHNVQFQSTLSAFYAAVPNSPYFAMLSQYSGISKGGRGTPVVDNKGAGTIADAQIRTELNALIAAKKVPAPTANTYYAVHFPPGATITAPDGSHSCQVFCAYHGTYKRGSTNVYYGVMPDQGGACAGGCGRGSLVNNTTSVSSHELTEATTDPAVGLATTFAAPLAWYDRNNGEIGDICNGQAGTVVGGDGKTYTVQKEWSNARNACVSQ